MKYSATEIQTVGCTWMQTNSNKKNDIMKNKKIANMETEEVKKEFQDQRSHVNESEGEQ
jgi:hypothetical protein